MSLFSYLETKNNIFIAWAAAFGLNHVVGISKQQLRKYELGRNKISARRLAQIAPILGVTISDLISNTPLTAEKKLSEIDIEARTLWLSIIDPEHKRTILSVMKMVTENKGA